MLNLFRFKAVQRVAFEDIDYYKVVNNSKYFFYFERARVEYLRKLDFISTRDKGLDKFDVAVVENYCSYRKPAYFDDLLDIHTRISYLKSSSLQFQYIIVRSGDGEKISCGYTNLVRVAFPSLKPRPLDGSFVEKVTEFENENLGKSPGIPDIT